MRATWREQGWQLATSSPTAARLDEPQKPVRLPPPRVHAEEQDPSQACRGSPVAPRKRGPLHGQRRRHDAAQVSQSRPWPALPPSKSCQLPTRTQSPGRESAHTPPTPAHCPASLPQLTPSRPLGPCQRPSNLRGRKRFVGPRPFPQAHVCPSFACTEARQAGQSGQNHALCLAVLLIGSQCSDPFQICNIMNAPCRRDVQFSGICLFINGMCTVL